MPRYLLRLVQQHPDFRKAELNALGELEGTKVSWIEYDEKSPFAVLELPSVEIAKGLVKRSILTRSIYELWGTGTDYISLHDSIRIKATGFMPVYRDASFKINIDSFQGSQTATAKKKIIDSFAQHDFQGPIKLNNPEEEFCVFERYSLGEPSPSKIYFGRFVTNGARDLINTFTLKKRKYIDTTSMDAELALIMANLALAGSGKLFYDPFVGTGSLSIAASHFGATCCGSDIDGRTIRGKTGLGIKESFEQYGLDSRWLDGFISDLVHTPLRKTEGPRFLDGVICDPPYGVREGLRVLGRKDDGGRELIMIDGQPAHLHDGYIHPKKPYSFVAMLQDIMEFGASTLTDGGRLSFWMPLANEDNVRFDIPSHRALKLVSICVQPFNTWSRRLLTYRRLPDMEITSSHYRADTRPKTAGRNADDLNNFRKRYFEGFR